MYFKTNEEYFAYVKDMVAKLDSIEPGEIITYYSGENLRDVPLVQAAAYQAYREGRAYLVQRRADYFGNYDYLAIGARRRP